MAARSPSVLAENGVELDERSECSARLERLGAYLELHIEQGPVLEAEGIEAAAVERLRRGRAPSASCSRGQAAHAGTTPMDARRDAGLAAAAAALRVEEIARAEGGVGTVGVVDYEPGIVTAVAGTASMQVDLRHRDADSLARMLTSTREAVSDSAQARGCETGEELIWRIEPIAFDPGLVESARKACEEVTGSAFELPSGALHDAASMAGCMPAAMIFSPSIEGVSHAREEDTSEDDLRVAIEAFGRLANSRLS